LAYDILRLYSAERRDQGPIWRSKKTWAEGKMLDVRGGGGGEKVEKRKRKGGLQERRAGGLGL
jgi:hypothetical protein